MRISESLRLFGLVPTDESLPIIREILAREADLEREGLPREDDLALLCCVQLFSRALPEDVLRIWAAKQSGFDLSCYLDVQFLCGSGLEDTKRYLAHQTSKEAAEALTRIVECEQAGDFADFTPANHLENYRQYFSPQTNNR